MTLEVEDILERWSVEARRHPSNRLARRVLALADVVKVSVREFRLSADTRRTLAALLQHADNASGLQVLEYAQPNDPGPKS